LLGETATNPVNDSGGDVVPRNHHSYRAPMTHHPEFKKAALLKWEGSHHIAASYLVHEL
jgi:hypothetical protein